MANQLMLTVGLPRSGKTTWALKQTYPIVAPDAIRLAVTGQRYVELTEPLVWAIAKIMVRALFHAGHQTVLLDATNLPKHPRVQWPDPHRTVRYHVVHTPPHPAPARPTY